MNIKKLTVTIKGPLWRIYDFEIEGVEVIDRYEENEEANEGSVSVTNIPSVDKRIDVFIRVGAPNGSSYSVQLAGSTANPAKDIDKSLGPFKVIKNGKLNILISELISDIII